MNLTAEAIAARFEPKLRKAVFDTFEAIKNRIPEKVVEEALTQRGITGVMSLLDNIEGDFGTVRENLHNAFIESGRAAITMVPAGGVIDASKAFDPFNPKAAAHVRDYELNAIRGITSETREAVRRGLQADIISGRNPVDTARTFRENLGLTPRQEQAVRNYRKELESLDRQALDRALKDGKFDRTVLNAIKNNKPLSPEQVDKMVGRYRERYIKYRSETIARTEAMRAASVGAREGMAQAIDEGAIDGNRLRRFWVYTNDSRTRSAHREIPAMNPDGVGFNEPYKTPLGPLMYPHDPAGSAENVIDCRCRERYSFIGDLSDVSPKVKPKPKPVTRRTPKPKSDTSNKKLPLNTQSLGELDNLVPMKGAMGKQIYTGDFKGNKLFVKAPRNADEMQVYREIAASKAYATGPKILKKVSPMAYEATGTLASGSSEKVIATEFLEGFEPLSDLSFRQQAEFMGRIDEKIKEEIILQDYMISAWDRGASNVMVNIKTGEIRLVDYEMSFLEKAPSFNDNALYGYVGEKKQEQAMGTLINTWTREEGGHIFSDEAIKAVLSKKQSIIDGILEIKEIPVDVKKHFINIVEKRAEFLAGLSDAQKLRLAEKTKVVVDQVVEVASKEQLLKNFLEKEKALAAFDRDFHPMQHERARLEYVKSGISYIKTLDKEELLKFKIDTARKMLRTARKGKASAEVLNSIIDDHLERALGWVPADIMLDMQAREFTINIVDVPKEKLRAYANRRDSYMSKAAGPDAMAHEFAHQIDYYFSGDTGLNDLSKSTWVPEMASSEEGYMSIFKNFRSEYKQTFLNGDGEFWSANWMDAYEGHIYKNMRDGLEFWSVNSARYAEYRYIMAKGMTEKEAAEISNWAYARQRYPGLADLFKRLFDKDYGVVKL